MLVLGRRRRVAMRCLLEHAAHRCELVTDGGEATRVEADEETGTQLIKLAARPSDARARSSHAL